MNMFTNFALVGTVKEMPGAQTGKDGSESAYITIACERSFPEADGSYGFDAFRIALWKGVAGECRDSCRIGSVVGFKGRIESICVRDEAGGIHLCPMLIAERVKIIRA